MVNIAEKIKYYRLKAGLSQEQLADEVGLTPSAISNYEKGKRLPDFETAKMISDILCISLNGLIGEEELSSYDPGSFLAESGVSIAEYRYAAHYREAELIRTFRQLTPDNQDIHLGEIKKTLREQKRTVSE